MSLVVVATGGVRMRRRRRSVLSCGTRLVCVRPVKRRRHWMENWMGGGDAPLVASYPELHFSLWRLPCRRSSFSDLSDDAGGDGGADVAQHEAAQFFVVLVQLQ